MNNILLTGSTGFIGKNLVKYLRDNNFEYQLFTPSRSELDLLDPEHRLCMKDGDHIGYLHGIEAITQYLLDHKIDAIIHLAGNVGGIGYNQNNQGKLGYENLQMGLNVLESTRRAGIKKLIMVGTTCSYPHTPKTIPFVEEELFDGMPEITNSAYGVSKRTLIKLAIEYNKQYNMQITNLIPSNMYGPMDHFEENKSHVIPAMIKKFENANLSIVNLWGSGRVSREFLYVEDFCRAISISLERDTGSEPINIGTGQEITIAVLAAMIKKIGKYRIGICWDDTKPNGQPRRSLDITKARKILRWESRVSLEQGLRKTIEWYQNENAN